MISSVSWCLPMVATAVFQTAIITLGAKSQKVQARSKTMLSFLRPMSFVVLQVFNPLADGLFSSQPGTTSCIVLQVCLQGVETQLAETSEGLQWTFLFLLPFASFIYPTIYIYILLIRQHTKNCQKLSKPHNLHLQAQRQKTHPTRQYC